MTSVILTIPKLHTLNSIIKRHYYLWVRGAPESYHTDDFLQSRVPITVTSEYGQNQEFGIRSRTALDQSNWSKDRDYTKIRYITLAVATHLRSVTLSLVSSSLSL
jgi:hypothetical protein